MDISTGLNSNTVYCTFQDSNGQMWFGTNDGLTTYDTYTFKTWRTDSNNPYSIGNKREFEIKTKNSKLSVIDKI